MRKSRVIWVLLTVCMVMVSSASQAAVKAAPTEIKFGTIDQAVTVFLSKEGGAIIRANEIQSFQLMASGHDYQYMLSYDRKDGQVTIRPKDLEIGSYDLIINTTAGAVTIKVDASLDKSPRQIENKAVSRGIPLQQLEKEEGLAKPLERATKLAISIGSPYYEGQTLSLTIPAEPGTTFRWTLNGQIIQEGLNANSLSYTFAKAGEYTLTVAELHNGQVVAEATDTTVVKALPAPK